MRLPGLTKDFVPKYRAYSEYAKVLKQNRQPELVSALLTLLSEFK